MFVTSKLREFSLLLDSWAGHLAASKRYLMQELLWVEEQF